MPYVAKPKPCYMDQFEFYKQGWHLGALDAKTGELIKQARKDRRLSDV